MVSTVAFVILCLFYASFPTVHAWDLGCDTLNRDCQWTGVEQWNWFKGDIVNDYQIDSPPALPVNSLIVKFNQTNQRAELTSHWFTPRAEVSCMTFWSYVRLPEQIAQSGILLKFVNRNGTEKKLWARGGRLNDNWNQHQVSIEGNEEIQLKFVATSESGVVGLYGFGLEVNECSMKSVMDCDFEGGDLCNWTAVQYPGRVTPLFAAGHTSTNKVFQNQLDHTSRSAFGGVAYMNSTFNNYASLLSPVLLSARDSNKCLRFWFMKSSDHSNVNVVRKVVGGQNTTQLFMSTYKHPAFEWIPVKIPLSFTENSVISISGYNTDGILIDDIHVTPICHSPASGFDLRSSYADWHSNGTQPWSIGKGRVMNASVYGTRKADYLNSIKFTPHLYTDFTSGSSHRMDLKSPPFIENQMCASLQFKIDAFPAGSVFALDSMDSYGKRTELWKFDLDHYKLNRTYYGERILIHKPKYTDRLSLIAEAKDPRTRIQVFSINVDNNTIGCENLSNKPLTPKSGLDPSTLQVIDGLLQSAQQRLHQVEEIVKFNRETLTMLTENILRSLSETMQLTHLNNQV